MRGRGREGAGRGEKGGVRIMGSFCKLKLRNAEQRSCVHTIYSNRLHYHVIQAIGSLPYIG